ncbi:hypothetical protein FVE85_3731 [Porphyridium purpureum]|uniref:Uncharacterized protein n=1 Tax=Porphyridium purpureum TaxID=35688 RepID=A0A5J4YNK8_PORPP|nr:hypothetical protein FVE85_3731 [Porphyridium purpureum]|eukprot:POR1665..scf249_10
MHLIPTTAIRAKTFWELRRALQEQIASVRGHRVVIRVVKSDRESGIVTILDDMKRPGILPNVTGAKEAVPAVERANSTLKDRTRAVMHGLPFAMPTTLVAELMKIEELSRKEALLQKQIRALDKRAAAHQVSDSNDALDEAMAVQAGLIEEKRDPQTGELVRLKARLAAGGDRQDPELYPNTSSPTVATESLFALAAMSATQGRKIGSVDF